MVALAKLFDKWLHGHVVVLLLLLLVIVLRVPNFFEPYWYGDEAIYLTVGNGIKDGERLYTEIIDHKTPLIYYLATVPNQLSFRLLNLGWMLVTTVVFYWFAKKVLRDQIGVVIASVVFVLLTTLPWFEGNIPNGELFVMGFVLVGAWIFSQTTLFKTFMEKSQMVEGKKDALWLFISGFLFGLGILTKVPAILDLGAFLMIGGFVITNYLALVGREKTQWLIILKNTVLTLVAFACGAIFPILLSILYFNVIGSGQDYLDYGLLYNFRYAGSWGLPFSSVLLQKLFTLPGKAAIMGAILVILVVGKRWFSRPFQFIVSWFALALFASLLSNRPYPHYFQQIVPSFSLLVGLLMIYLEKGKKHLIELGMAGVLLSLSTAVLILLGFAPYKTTEYYVRFVKLLTGQWTLPEYRQSFNHLMTDNYRAAEIIRSSGTQEIFIWGTNALLYALSDTQPVGRFTVSFHIKDFKAQKESMEKIRQVKPLFVVVMKDENESLPGLDQFLFEKYVPNTSFQYFTLWKRADVLGITNSL